VRNYGVNQCESRYLNKGAIRLSMAGFSFVEVLIVALLLGIVAVIAFPSINNAIDDSRLSAAADEVVTAFEFAQLIAMTRGRITKVVIREPENRIVLNQYETNADLFGGGDELKAEDVENGTYKIIANPMKKGTDYKINLADESRFEGVDITESDFDIGDAVTFDVLGAPSKGGKVALALARRKVVVTLDSMTGKVSVSE